MKKIAINGFGRIGRLALRQLLGSTEYKVVAINSRGTPEDAAYLFKYDTAHRTYDETPVSYNDEGIIIDGELIKTFKYDSPDECPWEELQVDVVLECTGVFTTKEKAQMHIDAGAKKVIISAPSKSNDIKTVVYGVNEDILTGDETIISAASCTTNCLAPVVKIIHDTFNIKTGYMTTIHAYTNDQATLDGSHSKGINSRRGRAAAENIVPTSTGAAEGIGAVLPSLIGVLSGMALRVPVPNGSCIDLTLLVSKDVTKEEINNLLINNSNEVLKLTMDPIVSSDIIGTTFGALVDGNLTKVESNNLIKIVAWYDNEYGYTAQMLRTMEILLKD